MTTVKRIAFDVDGVVSHSTRPYRECEPYTEAVRCIRLLKEAGMLIYYFTARGMDKYGQNQQKAREAHEQELIDWLAKWDIPNDGVFMGKPACDIYLDDKGMRLQSDLGAGEWTRLMQYLGEDDANMLRVGDVVELKSGGPSMTIIGIDKGLTAVRYFDMDQELIETTFPAGSLSVTERRWEGLTDDEVARAISEEDDESDTDTDEDDEDD